MTRERVERLPDDDWRKHNERFQEPQLSEYLALVDRLQVVADRHKTTPGAVAVAWTLRNPAVDGAIVGSGALIRSTRSSPRLTSNLATTTSRRSKGGPEMATDTATTTRIGFVGLGNMGGNMAARLLAAGYPVYGEERRPPHAEGLVQEGLQWRDTPREVAEAAEIVSRAALLGALLAGVVLALATHPAQQAWVNNRHEHRGGAVHAPADATRRV